MKRKIISMMLVFALVFSFVAQVYGLDIDNVSASTTNNLNTFDVNTIVEALADIAVHKDSYDFDDVDFSLLSVGENIPIYNYENYTMSPVGFKMYPIFCGSDLLAFAVVSDSETEYASAQIFRNIADDVKALNITYNDAIYFVYDLNGFNVVCNGEISTLCSMEESLFSGAYEPIWDGTIEYAVELGKNELQLVSIESAELQRRASNYISTPVTATTQTPSLYDNLCWAASVACIGRALTGTIYAASTVAKLYYGDNADFDYPAYCSQAKEALYNIYGISYTSYPAVPSDTRIRNNISGGYPLYGQFEGNGTTHAAVIYSSDSYNAYIGIMDPYSASKFNIYLKYNSSEGEWTYGYTNPYANNETIYLTQHVCKLT